MTSTDAPDGRSFRSPAILADVALLIVLVPIAWAALTFLLLFPLSLILVILKLEVTTPLVWLAAVMALAILAIGARLRLFWTLTLEDDGVRVGTWWPRRVPYSRIVYLSSGAAADPSAAIDTLRADNVPFVFGTGMFAARRIFLPRDEADRCLRAFYARCDNAGAIDSHGTVLPPRRRDAPPAATYRLAETLAIRGLSAIVTAVVSLALLFVPYDPGSSAWWRVRLAVLPTAPGLLAYGGYCLHRMWLVLR